MIPWCHRAQRRVGRLRRRTDRLWEEAGKVGETGTGLVVAGAIVAAGQMLVAQRARPAELAGLWELPGGTVEAGEGPADALVRELREELGVTVAVGARIEPAVPLPGGRTLIAYAAALRAGSPRALDHRQIRWVGAEELDRLDWVPADRAWIPALAGLLGAEVGPGALGP